MGKDIGECHAFCRLFYKEHAKSADLGCTKAVDIELCCGVYSWVGDSDNMCILVETLSLPCMHVQNALHDYII